MVLLYHSMSGIVNGFYKNNGLKSRIFLLFKPLFFLLKTFYCLAKGLAELLLQ